MFSDGNVPTNYKIQVVNTAGGAKIGEEKSLGRWVNSQRTIFQEGKLKKDRQMDLERIGLKWSALIPTPWSTIYGSLCTYAEEKQKPKWRQELLLSSYTSEVRKMHKA